ncbi:MAG: adenosylhomocysteinase [Thermoleophilaceae bacterium]|nr:adenosylhomocysteinase [Thermoleophilaceae bacterium]
MAAAVEIADPKLADAGVLRVEWAGNEMPALARITERFEREKPLAGTRIGACLHITAETANLVRALIAGGAEVAISASNPLSTQDEVAAALAQRYDARVFAVHGEDRAAYDRHIDAVCDIAPQITLDDGADVIGALHGPRKELLPGVLGGTEETTTGVIRLKALEREGTLAYPVIAVNEAQTQHLFDTRYGTGQSTLDGILRATNLLIAGRVVAVIGYGSCGKGVALRAKGLGANVLICEVDPLRALEAVMDGFTVLTGVEAAARADVIITVTGNRDAVAGAMFDVMGDGTIVCNAGHFDIEINKSDLDSRAAARAEVRPLVERYTMSDERRIYLLAEGRLVNLSAAEGHPPAVMDMSFANQALSVEHLVKNGAGLEPRIYPVPPAIDQTIARLKLESLRVTIDELTEAQKSYLTSWDIMKGSDQ